MLRFKIVLKIALFGILLLAMGYGQMIMYIDPPRVPPKSVGEQCTVMVRIRHAYLVYGWQTGLYFNQNVLNGAGINFNNADSLLRYAYGVSHNAFNIPGTWDNVNGVLEICGGIQLGMPDSGGIGDGNIMQLIFDVVGSGSSILDLPQEDNHAVGYVLDTAMNAVPYICQDGFYGDETVSPTSSFAINTGSGHQTRPAVAWNNNANEFLAVWESYSDATGNSDVIGERISSVGSLLGTVQIESSMLYHTYSPSVSWNGTNYMVVYMRKYVAWPYTYDIYGVTVSPTGTVGTPFAIATGTRYQGNPAITWNGTYHLVVWLDARTDLQPPRIYGQRLDASGSLVGGDIAISSNDGYYHIFPRVGSDGTDFLVIWSDSYGSDTDGRIRDRRVFSDGSIGSINTVASDAGIADLAWDGTNYLVVYQKANAMIQWNIYGRLVSSTGSTVGSEFAINTASSDQIWPRVIYETSSGKYLVNWINEQSMPAIWRQAVNTNGTLYKTPSVQAEANYHQMYPALAYGNTQDLIVWADMRSGSHFDIRGYRQVLIGIEEETQMDARNIIQVYPSPTTENLKIMLNLAKNSSNYHLAIYDVNGRLIREFETLNKNLIIWDRKDETGSLIGAGVYFVQLKHGSQIITKKVIISR
jgi:hypothetical protein